MAAAGLWTTPTDLARLAVEVQKSLRGDSNRVLSQEMTRQMLSPMEPGGHGLGFGLSSPGEGDARFGHGGSNHGFKCQLQAFVEGGQGAAIMTNGDMGSALAQEVLYAIAAEYGWDGVGPGDIPHPLFPSSELGFFDATDGARVVFTVGEEGRATELEVRGGLRGVRIQR